MGPMDDLVFALLKTQPSPLGVRKQPLRVRAWVNLFLQFLRGSLGSGLNLLKLCIALVVTF